MGKEDLRKYFDFFPLYLLYLTGALAEAEAEPAPHFVEPTTRV
jgi:hypothetical protein